MYSFIEDSAHTLTSCMPVPLTSTHARFEQQRNVISNKKRKNRKVAIVHSRNIEFRVECMCDFLILCLITSFHHQNRQMKIHYLVFKAFDLKDTRQTVRKY